MSQTVDPEEMKQCLKDANILEDDMSDEMLAQFYQAIKSSENPSSEENNKSMNESYNDLINAINESENAVPTSCSSKTKKTPFAAKQWSQEKKNILQLKKEGNNNEIQVSQEDVEEESIAKDITKTPIGFNDMPKSDKNMLKIINHELKLVNIQNSKRFLQSDTETRVKMLYNYHIAAERFRAQLTRMSTTIVPLPKPISGNSTSETALSPVITSLKEEDRFEELYVNRFGRHTKRKIYNEDESSQDEVSNKKSKNEEWISKNTSKSPKAPKKNDIVSSTTSAGEEDKDKLDKAPEKPRTYHKKTISNEDIMKKSSLFSDPPSKRTDALIVAGLQEENKRKRQEEKIEQFNQSLDLSQDDLSDDFITVDDVPEEVQKKRIVPPVPARRPISNRKRKEEGPKPLSITTIKKPASKISSSDDILDIKAINGTERKTLNAWKTQNAESKAEASSSSPSTTTRSQKTNLLVACPLCSVLFSKNTVEEHAATCGEELITQSNTKYGRISCEICEQVVPLSTDYQTHVKECMAKHKSSTH